MNGGFRGREKNIYQLKRQWMRLGAMEKEGGKRRRKEA